MKMICGLGNPGKKYYETRHNIGFMVIDSIAAKVCGSDKGAFSVKFKGEYLVHKAAGLEIMLVKPQTYMNLSGDCVRDIAGYYKIKPSDIMIVCDDVSIPFGKLRLRASGGDGGHNGLKSIFGCLGTDAIARLRVGIGPSAPAEGEGAPASAERPAIDLADFVLMKFSQAEKDALPKVTSFASAAAMAFVDNGMDFAMNNFNNRFGHIPPPPKPEKPRPPAQTATPPGSPAPDAQTVLPSQQGLPSA